jgi:hypothetical protein
LWITLWMSAVGLRLLADGRLRPGMRTTLWISVRLFWTVFLRSVVRLGLQTAVRLRNARLWNGRLRDWKLWHRRLRIMRSGRRNAVTDF